MNLIKEEEEEEALEAPKVTVVHVKASPSKKKKTFREIPRPRLTMQDSDVSRRFQWKSCCFKMDKRVLVFSSQLIISLIILAFSMIQLVGEHGTCEGSAPYLTLISTLIGYWLPSPTIK